MKSRAYRPEDLPVLKQLFHQQGFEYAFPDVDHPSFLVKEVVVDDQDVPVMACIARQTVEMFLLMDRNWSTPRWRWEVFKIIHKVMEMKLFAMGLQDVHAWLPPEIEKSFGKRLMRACGWVKQLWPSYSRKLTHLGE